MIQSYIFSISTVRNASDADISVSFPYFFFVTNLEFSCSNGTKTSHVNLVLCGP